MRGHDYYPLTRQEWFFRGALKNSGPIIIRATVALLIEPNFNQYKNIYFLQTFST
jgi:hypothetical protein